MKLSRDDLMIVSSTTAIVPLVKRNNTVTISKKWVPLSPNNNKPASPYKKRIIKVMTLFSESMKGKLTAPIRSITNTVKKISESSQGKTEFIHVAEAFTSQT